MLECRPRQGLFSAGACGFLLHMIPFHSCAQRWGVPTLSKPSRADLYRLGIQVLQNLRGCARFFHPHPLPLSHRVGEGSQARGQYGSFPLTRVAGEGAGGEGEITEHFPTSEAPTGKSLQCEIVPFYPHACAKVTPTPPLPASGEGQGGGGGFGRRQGKKTRRAFIELLSCQKIPVVNYSLEDLEREALR